MTREQYDLRDDFHSRGKTPRSLLFYNWPLLIKYISIQRRKTKADSYHHERSQRPITTKVILSEPMRTQCKNEWTG